MIKQNGSNILIQREPEIFLNDWEVSNLILNGFQVMIAEVQSN